MDLVLLHALPFDGSMWHAHLNMLPGHTHALSLYACGDNLTDWARKALGGVSSDKLIVVGNSVGGSCALEMAALSPERISALVLVGAKAARRIDSKLQDECIELIQNCGLEAAWDKYWAPFFAPDTDEHVLASAKEMALQLSPEHVAHGVRAFHTRPSRFELLAELDSPVICVTGEHDIAPGIETMQAQADAAKNGQLIVVPDCGHYVPIEKPKVMRAIIQDVITKYENQM